MQIVKKISNRRPLAGFIPNEGLKAYLRSPLFEKRCTALSRRQNAGERLTDKDIGLYLGVYLIDLARWADYRPSGRYLRHLKKTDRPRKG
jgi:hypothetical protein